MQEEHVVATHIVTDLAGRLEERLRLDVTDGATDLGDHHIRHMALEIRTLHRQDAALDLVGDVRNDLHRIAQILTATFLGDHRRIDLTGGHVRVHRQIAIEEALVVTDVQVGLRAVLGDEHLAVLERVHGARIDIEIRVELLHRHPHAARGQKLTEAGGGETLTQ